MGHTCLMVNFFHLLWMISSRMCVSIFLLIMSMITGIMMTMIARLFFLCFSCWWGSGSFYGMSDMFSFRMSRCWFMCMICLVISSCICRFCFDIFSSQCTSIVSCHFIESLTILEDIVLVIGLTTDERCDSIAECSSDKICRYSYGCSTSFQYSFIDDISYSFDERFRWSSDTLSEYITEFFAKWLSLREDSWSRFLDAFRYSLDSFDDSSRSLCDCRDGVSRYPRYIRHGIERGFDDITRPSHKSRLRWGMIFSYDSMTSISSERRSVFEIYFFVWNIRWFVRCGECLLHVLCRRFQTVCKHLASCRGILENTP